jgi:hypothetical protein
MFEALKSEPLDYFKMLFGVDNDSQYFNTHYYNKMYFWYRDAIANSNLFSDSHAIIRFNALIRIFSFGYIHVHNVFINFLSLIGLTFLFKAFKPYFSSHKKAIFYVIFLIPSILFWGSGLLKESILFFALGLFIFSYFSITKKFSSIHLFLLVCTIIIITYTKLYILAALFPACLGWVISKKILNEKPILSYSISLGVTSIICVLLNFFSTAYNPFLLIIKKQKDFNYVIDKMKPASSIYITDYQSTTDVILNIPSALFNTLTRPFIGNISSPLTLISALENLFFLLFIILCLIFIKKLIKHKNAILFCFTFSVTLLIIIGLTTPIIGAIVRYKIPALLLISIGLLLILDIEKLKSKFTFLNKIL